ncbi:MAG: hypothetical protein DLM72_05405 [Candidatus Nitrosopolaris wilkensis]|nr:MAG: hypothetical protein DLM72_05405 [Candidatus Nitrosopolaris wilkensis]
MRENGTLKNENGIIVLRLTQNTYEQFREITETLLSRHKVWGGVASVIPNSVWNNTRDVRDCVRISTLAKSTKDVEFIVNQFFGHKTRQETVRLIVQLGLFLK